MMHWWHITMYIKYLCCILMDKYDRIVSFFLLQFFHCYYLRSITHINTPIQYSRFGRFVRFKIHTQWCGYVSAKVTAYNTSLIRCDFYIGVFQTHIHTLGMPTSKCINEIFILNWITYLSWNKLKLTHKNLFVSFRFRLNRYVKWWIIRL